MAEVGQISVSLGVNAEPFQRGIRTAERALETFESRTAKISEALSRAGDTLTRKLSVPLGVLGGVAIKAGGDLEALRLALESQAGSAEEAEKQLRRLRDVAREPGLSFEEAVRGSVQLQAVGNAAETAERRIQGVARAVSRSAGSAEDFGEVVRQLTQIQAAGKLTEENLAVIKERAPEIAKALQSAFGTSTAEGIRATGVSVDEFLTKLDDALLSLDPAKGGILNSLANAADDLKTALAPLGETIAQVVIPPFTLLVSAATKVSEAFAALPDFVRQAIVGVGGLVVVLGPLLAGLGFLVKVLPLVAGGFSLAFGKPLAVAQAALALFGGFLGPIGAALAGFATKIPIVGTALGALAGPLAAVRGAMVAALGPVGAVAVAIVALAALAGPLIADFDKVRAFFADKFPRASAAISQAFGDIRAAAERVLSSVGEAFASFRPILDSVARVWERWGAAILRVVDGTFSVVVRLVGGTLANLVDLFGVALSVISGDWSGAFDGLKRIAVRSFSGIAAAAVEGLATATSAISAFLDGVSEIGTQVAGVGLGSGNQGLVAAGTLLNGLASGAADFADAASQKLDGLRDSIDAVRDAASGAAAPFSTGRGASFGGGGSGGPGGGGAGAGAGLDQAGASARTVADVVRDLNARLALTGANLEAGFIQPLAAAKERADALRSAFGEAFRVAGNKLTPAVAALRDRAQEAAREVALAFGGIDARAVDAGALSAALEPLSKDFVTPLDRTRAAIKEMGADLRDVALPPDLVLDVSRLSVVASQAAEAVREGVRSLVDGLAFALGDSVAAFGSSLLGALGVGMGETRDRIAEIQAQLSEGGLGADQARRLREELDDLKDTLNPIKAAFETLKSVVSRVMASVVADISAAIAKALILAGLKSLFAGATGGVGGFIAGALGFSAPAAPVASFASAPAAPQFTFVVNQSTGPGERVQGGTFFRDELVVEGYRNGVQMQTRMGQVQAGQVR